jgi:hypothetical protein
LKLSVSNFEPVKRIQQLETSFTHLIGVWPKLFRVLNGKPDSIDRDTSLIGHFEFRR